MEPYSLGEMNFSESNLSEAWRKWKTGMGFYLDSLPEGVSDKQKFAKFLLVIGEEGREIFSTWNLDETANVKTLFEYFEAYCTPKRNLVVERHKFFLRNQKEYEGFDVYAIALKQLASSCEFGNLNEDLLCLRIVGGIYSDVVREKLLRE